MERLATIYLLIDPRTGYARYVGWTIRTLADRLYRHCTESKSGSSHKCRWIRQVLSEGSRPLIWPIETTYDRVAREQFWIAHYRNSGCPLVNATEGGDPGGPPWSEETRTKHMAYWTPERRQAVSDRFKGKKKDASVVARSAAGNRGKLHPPHTEETKARIAASTRRAKLGQKRPPFSDEWRENIRKGTREARRRSSNVTQGQIEEARYLHAIGQATIRELMEQLGISETHMRGILSGERRASD